MSDLLGGGGSGPTVKVKSNFCDDVKSARQIWLDLDRTILSIWQKVRLFEPCPGSDLSSSHVKRGLTELTKDAPKNGISLNPTLINHHGYR